MMITLKLRFGVNGTASFGVQLELVSLLVPLLVVVSTTTAEPVSASYARCTTRNVSGSPPRSGWAARTRFMYAALIVSFEAFASPWSIPSCSRWTAAESGMGRGIEVAITPQATHERTTRTRINTLDCVLFVSRTYTLSLSLCLSRACSLSLTYK